MTTDHEPAFPSGEGLTDPVTAERYRRLLALGRRLTSTLDIGVLQALIVQATADLVPCEGALLVTAGRDGALQVVAASIPDTPLEGPLTLSADSSLAGAAIAAGGPLQSSDAAEEAAHFGARQALAVPFAAGTVTGCLEAINPLGGAFGAADREVLAELAALAASALHNAYRFDQSDLISEMIHELRTPLAAVKSTMHIILRPELTEEKRQHLVATVQRETDRLARMTGDFLKLARLESGRTPLRREPVDVSRVVDEAVDAIRGKAMQAGVDVRCTLSPEGGWPPIEADGALLSLAVHNLLLNAVKYNGQGGTVEVTGRVASGGLEVEVADTGRGIAPENLPYVFDRFFRVPDEEGYTDGSGLGLAIARCIVEGCGGTIGAESEKGVGTTVRLWLPLA